MQVLTQLFYIGLCACCFLCLYRIGRGPSAPDRTVAIDILTDSAAYWSGSRL